MNNGDPKREEKGEREERRVNRLSTSLDFSRLSTLTPSLFPIDYDMGYGNMADGIQDDPAVIYY